MLNVKRIFDFLVAICMLIFAWPIILLVAILVGMFIGTPIIFKQKRPGRNAQPFWVYKFRSMTDAKDENGVLLPDSERITAFGTWLRKTSLDELPQIFNVINGDMSLVGPRPLLMEYLELYTPEQMRRHTVRPGMVSLASVSGRNLLSWEEKFALDSWYVDNWSLWLDIQILIKTVFVVLGTKGVSHSNHVTMPKYSKSVEFEKKINESKREGCS